MDGGNDQSYFLVVQSTMYGMVVVEEAYLLRLIIARNLKMRKGNRENGENTLLNKMQYNI